MLDFLSDVKYGLRGLRRSPGFTAVALITLALGIGANTAIFSVVNTVLIQPLPYKNPDRLVMLWQSYPTAGFDRLGASPPEYLDYRDRNQVFSGVAGYADLSFNLTGVAQPDRIKAARVTGNLFSLLDVPPMMGRILLPEDDRAGGPKLVVVSYAFWKQQLHSESGVLGKSIRLDEQPYTIVGVMPASFRFPFDGTPLSNRADLWVPMEFSQAEIQARAVSYDVRMLARLKDGVSLPQARADVERIANALIQEHPDIYSGNVRLVATVSPFAADVVAKIRPALLILLGAVGFVLLIACANVANLLLARASGRRREVAVRSALGASGGRLMRQVLAESVTLAVIGGTFGLLVAFVAVNVIVNFGPEQLTRIHDVSIDPAVLFFSAAVSLLTGLLFGLAPALRVRRVDLNESLKAGAKSAGESRERQRGRNILVVVETACAVLLLFGAGLLINSFIHVLRVSPGFNPNNMLMARTAFDRHRYPDPQQRGKVEQEMLARFRQLPGVRAVGLSVTLPLRDDRGIGFRIEDANPNEFHHASNDLVSNDYLQAMGIPVLQGRTFTDQDRPDTPLVALINQTMAQRFWPHQDAIGKHFLWGDRTFSVIGVTGDAKISGLDADVMPVIYMSAFQVESGISFQAVFAIRTENDPRALAGAVRDQIWASDKELPVYDIVPMTEVVAESLAQRRFTMLLLAAFAAVALLMAAVGIYGVISYSVAQRTRELGVRIALGATAGRVLSMVLLESSKLVLLGIMAGTFAALLLARSMRSLLFGVRPFDSTSFVVAALLLGLAALVAGYIPARRATKVDPMVALRYE
jgi:putative ABC transport system permease protein